MKRIIFIFVLIFACIISVWAQTEKASPCPTISVSGIGVGSPVDTNLIFSVFTSKEADKYNLQYKWTVSGGELLEGQGTPSIKVKMKLNTLRADLEVVGLPKHCSNIASGLTHITPAPPAKKIDEFSISPPQIDKARLDVLIKFLSEDPPAQTFIIERFKLETSPSVIEQKLLRVFEYLTQNGIEENRIHIIKDSADENSTVLWLNPAGASPPECDGCVTAKFEKVGGKIKVSFPPKRKRNL